MLQRAVARSELKPLFAVMPQTLAKLAETSGRGELLEAAWRRAVGERIAAEASCEAFAHGTLHLRVRDLAWAKELSSRRAELIQRLNAELGGEVVKAIALASGER